MMTMKNSYKICENYVIIYYTSEAGENFEILVDEEDFNRIVDFGYSINCHRMLNTGLVYPSFTEYVGKNSKGKSKYKSHLLHRFILNFPDFIIDHVNNNTLDDRKSNLKLSNKSLNGINRIGANKNNVSGYRNVSLHNGKYFVQLQIDGKNKVLGSFANPEEANTFAEEMRRKYYE